MKSLEVRKEIETVLCAAVGTESHQPGLEACSVY
jgi:hypothetical protein